MRRKASGPSSRSERRSSRGNETPARTRDPRPANRGDGTFRVRAARPEDLTKIAALWRDLLAYHRDIGEPDVRPSKALPEAREFIREHIRAKGRLCLVAEADGAPVGFLVAALRKRSPAFGGWRYGHINDVYVEGHRRKEGIGTALVETALRWFRSHGVHRVQLQVRARNEDGIEFWRSHGFEDLARTLERHL